MADFNKVVLVGRLTRDPELRATPSGMAVCKLGVAVGRKYKDKSGNLQQETTFVDVDVWAKSAENCAKYLSKGSALLVDGELRMDQWEDKTSGEKRSKLKVTANSVQFLGPAKKKAEDGSPGGEAEESDIPF